MKGGNTSTRTVPQLFRDCLRLISHVAGKSKKAAAMRKVVSNEFRKNMKVSDPAVIDVLKSNAIRGLANYLMIESSQKDERFKEKAANYSSREADSIKKNPSDSNNK